MFGTTEKYQLRDNFFACEDGITEKINMEKLIKEPELESLWNGGKKIINR